MIRLIISAPKHKLSVIKIHLDSECLLLCDFRRFELPVEHDFTQNEPNNAKFFPK